MLQNYFSFKGRINRKPFWLRTLVLYVAIIVLMGLVYFAAGGPSLLTGESDIFGGVAIIGGIFFLVAIIAFYVSIFSLSVRRLHDRNKSGWWVLFVFIISAALGAVGEMLKGSDGVQIAVGLASLIISIWFLIEVGFRKGTIGANNYGPDPLSGAVADPEVFGRRDDV